MTASETRLVALDWGTSSLRAHRLGAGGAVLESRRLALGVAAIAREHGSRSDRSRAFERAFDEACGDWTGAGREVPVIACGMVGSAHGWRKAPYVEVPAAPDQLAAALTAVEAAGGATLHIVPGLIERGRLPDMMRGEETQIAGALDHLDPAALASCRTILVGLPGTHSKWAQVRAGVILHFDTFMTGEVYEALCSHTLLALTLRRSPAWDVAAFERGARIARTAEGRAGPLSTIFSTRALALTGALSAEAQADYLSGLLIGHEIEGLSRIDPRALAGAERIVLAGDDALCERYRRALDSWGHAGALVAHRAAERGLWRIARLAGLVGASTDEGRRRLRAALTGFGLIAILRGVAPEQAVGIGAALYAAGLRSVEVPLNSPRPLASIRALRQSLPVDCAIGAGTVLTSADAEEAARAGADFAVMPNTDESVIRAAVAAGLEAMPGVATASEAFAALAAGADVLKVFPADQLGAGTMAAWRAVLPAGTLLVAVGGVAVDAVADFAAAGADGLGLGSALYRPGLTAGEVGERAARFAAAWRAATAARRESGG